MHVLCTLVCVCSIFYLAARQFSHEGQQSKSQRPYSQWRDLHNIANKIFQLLLNVQPADVFCGVKPINNLL